MRRDLSAGSAAAAFRLMAEARPDVLVCDIAMPDQDGFALLRELRAQKSNDYLPALAVTAYARSEDRDAARAAGFTEHLAKPVDIDTLARTVARLAGRP